MTGDITKGGWTFWEPKEERFSQVWRVQKGFPEVRAKPRLLETPVRMGEGDAFRWYNLKLVQSTRGKRMWCILETARAFSIS